MRTTVYPKPPPTPLSGDTQDDTIAYFDFMRREEKISIEYSENRTDKAYTLVNSLDFLRAYDSRLYKEDRNYDYRLVFFNYTNYPIIMVDRSGMPVTLPIDTINNQRQQGLIIRKEHYFKTRDMAHACHANIKRLGAFNGAEISGIERILDHDHYQNIHGRRVNVMYQISEAEILGANGNLYHQPTDTIFSMCDIQYTAKHPCSPEYVGPAAPYLPNYPDIQDDLTLRYRYVTNNPIATPKYVRVANKVIKLTPQYTTPPKLVEVPNKDKSLRLDEMSEYLELLYPAKADAACTDVQGYTLIRYTLDDAKHRLGLYDTREEASRPELLLDQAERVLKEKISEQDKISQKLVQDLKEKKEEYQEALRRKDIELDDLKRINHREQEAVKEQREEQAHKRKLNYDFFKFLTGAIASILVLIPIIIKYKTAMSA